MNNDCAAVRKLLPRYLKGHLFRYQRNRIARHLGDCPVCRSEFQSLQMIANTRQLLDEVNASEGLGRHLRTGSVIIGKLKVLIYRPLWLLAIIGALTLVYLNLIAPQRRDIEIENIEKTLPPPSPAVMSVPAGTAHSPAVPQPAQPEQAAAKPQSAPAAPAEPLVVMIAPSNDKAVGRVNEILHGYAELKKKRFSESVHEISGSLPAEEFAELFGKIEQAARVSYNRKKALSYPASQPIPFVMKMKPAPAPAPAPAERKPSAPAAETGEEPQPPSQSPAASSPAAP